MATIAEQTGLTEELGPEDQAALDAEQRGEAPEQPEQPEGQPQAQLQTNPEAQQQAEQAAEKGKGKKKPDVIPYDRFQEVNERARAAEAQAAELREKWARLEERQRLAQEADQRMQQAAQQAKQPQRPDPAIDPVGAELWDRDQQIAELRSTLQQVQQGLGQTAQTVQQQAQIQDFQNWIQGDVQTYRVQKPDYDQRAQVAMQKMLDYATSIGAPPQEAQLVVQQLANWIAQTTRRNGSSAAEAYYRFSDMIDPRTAAPAQGQPAAPAGKAAETLRQVQKGQQFQGLSRVPAENDDNRNWANLSAADLAEMSEDEFLARYQDPKTRPALEAAMRRLDMGA